jgi:hypothetical protein
VTEELMGRLSMQSGRRLGLSQEGVKLKLLVDPVWKATGHSGFCRAPVTVGEDMAGRWAVWAGIGSISTEDFGQELIVMSEAGPVIRAGARGKSPGVESFVIICFEVKSWHAAL